MPQYRQRLGVVRRGEVGSLRVEPVNGTPPTKIDRKWRDQVVEVGEIAGGPTLGHKDVTMVAKVYGRFKPHTEERDRWERIVAARDVEKWPSQGAKGGAPLRNSFKWRA